MGEIIVEIDENDYTCDGCGNLLSVPPIIYVESVGILCGRCEPLAYSKESNPTKERQIVFEKIAQNWKFSCKNTEYGCEAKLSWNDVVTHEESCIATNCDCFYNLQELTSNVKEICQWSGTIKEYGDHVKMAHNQKIIEPVKMDLDEKPRNQLVFGEFLDYIIVIILYFNVKSCTYFCQLMTYFEHKKKIPFYYQIQIFDKDEETSINLPIQNIQNLYPSKEKWIRNCFKIKMEYINILPKASYILVNFLSSKPSDISSTAPDISIRPKCNNCGKQILGNIYTCSCSHNMCKSCVDENSTKLCFNRYYGTYVRDYELENFFRNIPCENIGRGCKYKNEYFKVIQHQKKCVLKLRDCHLKNCSWNGENFILHFQEKHDNFKLNMLYNLCDSIQETFVFDNVPFTLDMEILNSTISFIISCCTHVPKTSAYGFEVEILNRGDEYKRLLMARNEFESWDSKLIIFTIERLFIRQYFGRMLNLVFRLNIKKLSEETYFNWLKNAVTEKSRNQDRPCSNELEITPGTSNSFGTSSTPPVILAKEPRRHARSKRRGET